ncbi:hypothetical protein [Autumnicola psychrophila]|uniref:Uncharacterized protein n=1 Tax=Autumnicola psychrophila TaxID=3075592 RepID=A0ABU3DTG2_9FLAO|nr:hypothetical protein [Zunongwangia sp. F225]MDT0686991.1 hypothetical protein [Zunongwangia sp. F225]
MMMVKVKFDKGTIGYVHDHFLSLPMLPPENLKTIDGKSEILEAGDTFFVQPNLRHGQSVWKQGL